MATWMDRSTDTFTQMGGEGVTWVGQAPFTDTPARVPEPRRRHLLPLRLAGDPPGDRRRVNITYKILYNDAVAMTGGQPVDGPLTRAADRAPGAQRRRADDRRARPTTSTKWTRSGDLPGGRRVPRPRASSTRCRSACAKCRASSVLIYDQTCAAEKRRRRKRGKMVDPAEARGDQRAGLRRLRRLRREVELRVGAAAGDRVRPQARDRPEQLQQGLLLRQRLLPELRHRATAARCARRKAAAQADRFDDAAGAGAASRLDQPWNILVTGVGGTGVVTIGALLGMAGAPRRQGRERARPDRPGAEGRRGHHAHPHRARRRPTSTPCASPPAKPTSCSAATWSWSTTTGRCRRSAPAARRSCSTATRRCRARSPRDPDMQFPATDIVAAIAHRARRRSDAELRGRRHAARDRADGRRDRDQPVHARLRLAAGRWCRCRSRR